VKGKKSECYWEVSVSTKKDKLNSAEKMFFVVVVLLFLKESITTTVSLDWRGFEMSQVKVYVFATKHNVNTNVDCQNHLEDAGQYVVGISVKIWSKHSVAIELPIISIVKFHCIFDFPCLS